MSLGRSLSTWSFWASRSSGNTVSETTALSRYPEPNLVDPRGAGEGTDMSFDDPSGNLLTFWKA